MATYMYICIFAMNMCQQDTGTYMHRYSYLYVYIYIRSKYVYTHTYTHTHIHIHAHQTTLATPPLMYPRKCPPQVNPLNPQIIRKKAIDMY